MEWYKSLIEEWNQTKEKTYEERLHITAEIMLRNKIPVEILSYDQKLKNDITQRMVEILLGK